MSSDLARQFGRIDIYLFDQLLRGRVRPGMRIVDAGCGSGRNLVYLLRNGYDVFGVDGHRGAIDDIRRLASELAPHLAADHFRVEAIENMSFADGFADLVISNSVLHFARSAEQFEAMLREMWRVLRPGGMFFCRLASDIGMEARMRPLGGRRFLTPEGADWYLVNETMLLDCTRDLGGELLDPLKTTIVQDQRCMTTWVVRKLQS